MSAEASGARPPRRSVLPDAGSAGVPLSAAIGVVSLLAALALAAMATIFEITDRWTDDIERSVTVRVRGVSAQEIERDVAAVLRVLETTGGVAGSRVIDRAEAAELLAPWLGSGGLPADFPVPALIAVEFARGADVDLELLGARTKAAAPGASVDDHRAWNARLIASSRTLQGAAVAVFLVVLGAAAAVASFAARASLAANDEIVDVLHLMGATDGYIAAAIQRRLIVLAGVGAAGGAIAACIFYAIASGLIRGAGDGLLAAAGGGWGVYLWTPLAPLACVGAAILAGRRAAMRALAERL